MYVAVKGGEKAIANAHALLAKRGSGQNGTAQNGTAQSAAEDNSAAEDSGAAGFSGPSQHERIAARQVRDQMGVLVSRVMNEGSLYDPDLAAKALLQSQGDVLEAITLLRSYRTTLPRFGVTAALDTGALPSERRISATFKDIPGGQQLGATFDYTHRLLADELETPEIPRPAEGADGEPREEVSMPRVTDLLGAGALVEPDHPEDWKDPDPGDLTREPTTFPMTRAERLQALARGDEGFLLSLGYSTQRGYSWSHPFAGEIRVGEVEVFFDAPEVGHEIPIGRIEVTECQMVNQFVGSARQPAQFTRGYGLSFARAERKAMSMALVDRSLRADEFGERRTSPAQDEEFVIAHSDNVQATGFVEHLKLPHYVDFQAELVLLRQLRAEFDAPQGESAGEAQAKAAVPSADETQGPGQSEGSGLETRSGQKEEADADR